MRRLCALGALVALAGPACDEGGRTLRAYKVKDRGELIGGPGAIGQIGDYVLENDRIRAVVLGPRTDDHSAGPGIFGGSLADIDLVRTEAGLRGGQGLDSFAELFPLANLLFQDPPDLGVEILADGAAGDEARIRVTARSSLIFRSLGLLFEIAGMAGVPASLQGEFCFRTDYVLRPGERLIEIETVLTGRPAGTVPGEGDPDVCTLDPGADVLDMTALVAAQAPAVFETLLGRPADAAGGGAPGFLPGIVGGDFLYFGHTTEVFGPGLGFDKERAFFNVADAGRDTFAEPLAFPVVAGVGDRVSYAVAAANPVAGGGGEVGGDVLVPLFLSSATVAVTALQRCSDAGTDDDACDRYRHWRFRRLVGVGEGDVASAWAPILRRQGRATGRVEGAVVNGGTGRPIPGAQVFLMVPPAMQAGEAALFRDGGLPYDAYAAAVVRENALGDNGIVNQILADRGTDPVRDGRFEAVVPPGHYAAVAYAAGRSPSNPVPVTVGAGQTVELTLTVPGQGTLEWFAYDETGRQVPVKVTVLVPQGERQAVRPELGDPLLVDGIYEVRFDGDGHGQMALPAPGRFDVIVSRGFEYEVHRETVTMTPRRTTRIHALVERVVDTAGWISADLHVHAAPSFDSGVSPEERAITMAAEGVEYFVSTDHDVITDYGPVIRAARLDRFVASDPGVETTTIELGHFIGFPLEYRFDLAPTHGAPDWWDERPHGILSALRGLGRRGPDRTVVTVPHPRDGFFGYFDQFGLDPYSLKKSTPTTGLSNPLQTSPSCDFDSIEILNGKRYELIRTPTVAETLGFMRERKCLGHRWSQSPAELGKLLLELNERYTRQILVRTPEEQAAWLEGAPTCDVAARVKAETPCEWPSEEPEDHRPCDDHEGVLDDWFRLLLATRPGPRGAPDHTTLRAPTGLANSDTHGKTDVEAGFPRNWVRAEDAAPARLDHDAVADAILDRRVTAGAGPFVELWVNGAEIGGVAVGQGDNIVRVRVQSPSWFAVTRVEVYRSGELIRVFDLPADGIDRRGAVDLDETFADRDAGAADVWYVAVALGVDDRRSRLSPYYTAVSIPPLQFSDAATDALGSTALGAFLGASADVPRYGVAWPYSFTNPVWVDGDGQEGWTPPLERALAFCEASPDAPPAGSPEADEAEEALTASRTLRRFMLGGQGH